MKKFRELLLAGIDEDIHGTTIQRLVKVKETFESEMIYNGIKPSMELLTKWLQGLPWAVHVPYENHAIIEWYETTIKRKLKTEHIRERYDFNTEAQRFLEKYWVQCGRTLYEMLYK